MKKQILFFLLTITMFTYQNLLHACSCAADPPFCENVFNDDGSTWAELIVVGEKVGDYDRGMEVKVLQILHGETTQEILHVNRGNGADCGVNTDIFEVGDRLILALNPYTFNEPDTETYMLTICGASYLHIRSGYIEGRISSGVNSLPFSELSSIGNCSGLVIDDISPEFYLYPNPATPEKVNVIMPNGGENALGYIRIFDISGKAIRSLKLDTSNDSIMEVPLYNLPAGMYYLELDVLTGRKAQKLIIQ